MDATQHHYWFRSRKYGFGWEPSSWQGWTILFLYLITLVLSFMLYDKESNSVLNFLTNVLPVVVVTTFILMWIMYATGEPPHYKAQLENRF